MKYLSLIIMTVLLAACGGGGEGETNAVSESTVVSAPSTTVTPPATTETTVTEDNKSEGVASLSVSPQFDFTTDVTVNVSVAAQLVSERAFLNICPAEVTVIDSTNCFVRAPLTSDGLEVSFVIPHPQQQVKANIWFYDVGMEPLTYEWQFNFNSSEQSWFIN